MADSRESLELPGYTRPPATRRGTRHAADASRMPVRAGQVAAALAPRLLFLALLAGAWQAMAHLMHSPLIPGLADIGHEILRIVADGEFFVQMWITIKRVLLGFAVAFALALAAGIAMGRSRAVHAFFDPAVLIGLTVPGLVWALLCVIWFGVALTGSAVAVALSVAPALFLNISQGVRAVNADLVEMAHMLRLPLRARIRYLWLPTLIPFLLAGARLGLSLAWKVIVLVEVFGLSSGVGYQLNIEFSSQNVAGVLAWTLCFSLVMALIEYGVLARAERRLTRWRRTSDV